MKKILSETRFFSRVYRFDQDQKIDTPDLYITLRRVILDTDIHFQYIETKRTKILDFSINMDASEF